MTLRNDDRRSFGGSISRSNGPGDSRRGRTGVVLGRDGPTGRAGSSRNAYHLTRTRAPVARTGALLGALPEAVLVVVGRAIALDRHGALVPPRWLPDPATAISIARRLIDAWTTRQADG